MARPLTRFDEFPRHQTIATFDQIASASPQWSDGYYFTLGDAAGEAALFTAIRLYPNNNVIDAYACLSTSDGKQQNVRWSRRLRPRIDDLEAGPFWMEIVEGLRTIRLGLRENEYGLSFEVLWEGVAPCYNEVHEPRYADGRLLSDRANYAQVGNVSGWLQTPSRRYVIDETWSGGRDHSWGVGETGGPAYPHAAPLGARPQPFGFRQWVLARMPGRALYWQFHRSPAGVNTMFESRVMPPYGADAAAAWAYQDARLDSAEFVDGQRRLKQCVLAFTRPDGRVERFGMAPISRPVTWAEAATGAGAGRMAWAAAPTGARSIRKARRGTSLTP